MVERLKNLPKLILEWWKKFNKKQKMMIISISSGIVIALAILAVVLTRPTMVNLINCESTKETSEVKELLEENNIEFEVAEDGLEIKVNKLDKTNAIILLGANNIPASEYDLENVFSGGFSTTSEDKNKRYRLYLEERLESHIASVEGINSVSVSLTIPQDDGTIIAKKEQTYASILLSLEKELGEEQAASLAQFVATAVGNENTNTVTIIDSDSNVLFAGGDASTAIGGANSQLAIRDKAETKVKGEVKDVILGTKVYDNVDVGLNLSISFDTTNVVDHRYYIEDGRTEGFKDSESVYEEESYGGTAGVPGTDSNNSDNTTYYIPDNGYSSTTINERDTDYALNETTTETKTPAGVIVPEKSSISVVASQYKVIKEDDLKRQGVLEGTTFDDYMLENNNKVKLEVDDELYDMVANATGIPRDSITIVAYEVPFFQPSESAALSWTQIAQYVLMGLILVLLGFVVYRSTKPAEVLEMEPELSVETLLESTRTTEKLEDIDLQEKSEARIVIEKFVDENPEAVASLLRNWLDEEWE